jgi:uncharacterized membrane protein
MRGFLSFVKTTVIGGLLFLVPLMVLLFVLNKAYHAMLVVAQPLARQLDLEGFGGIVMADLLAVAMIVLLCFFFGLLAKTQLARRLARSFETKVLQRIPVYSVAKSVLASVVPLQQEEGLQAVLVAFDDCSQLGLEIERRPGGQVVVYLPGSPNPWSGSLLMTTPERVTPLPTTMVATLRVFQQLGKGANALVAGAPAAGPAAHPPG